MEGVAIMKKEDVQCSITGNSTNPVRFQHLVAGTYKKWAIENGKKYFSVFSIIKPCVVVPVQALKESSVPGSDASSTEQRLCRQGAAAVLCCKATFVKRRV